MNVLFDLNVLLDLFLDRAPWVVEAKVLAADVLSGKIRGFVSASVFPTSYYLARKTVGNDQAFVSVRRCPAAFEVVSVTRSTLETAATMPGSDFEDNIIAGAAGQTGIDVIVMRDPNGFRGISILVQSPAELITHLATRP